MQNEIEQDLQLGAGLYDDEPAEQSPDETLTADVQKDEGYFGKPDKYDYSEVELPQDYYYNNELLAEFNDLAAKYNLSQKSANELMNMAVKMTKLAGTNLNNEIEQQKKERIMEYKKALINDRDLGGFQFDKTMQTANTAYKFFADNSVQSILQETGLDCHPGIIKMFYQIGRLLNNDDFFGVASPPVKKESREDILFPTM